MKSKPRDRQAPTDAKAIEVQGVATRTPESQETAEESLAGFPIVGIGASAGGLAAFEAFFSGMPADTDPGMAFVLVQHLAPDHKSILAELIRRCTRMRVFEVEDGMTVEPNCTYIIPPNCDMAFLNGTLQLMEPSAPRGLRLPIDFFFRSLAQDQHERAICIVLSGTGSDGTLGVRAIKGEGGMVMAQTPDSTEYDGMPRSAIGTGLVDFELPPAEMPGRLFTYAARAFGQLAQGDVAQEQRPDNALKKIFVLLRAQTGHDFSQYKLGTIRRRIERRMAVHQVGRIDTYVKYLQQTPTEVEALFRDFLIGVTSFFRDPEAFKVLEDQVIPKLFAGKPGGSVIRVWVPGCSTGEEAYSLAILLREHLEALKQDYGVQIFATDIDHEAIANARQGVYPANIAADISPKRLARFFEHGPDGITYRVTKGIRDMLVLSEQDMIKNPPFSRLDLISCRNVLIYMGTELQKKLVHLFHYALNPGGVLFLGTSETVSEFRDLFATLDRKCKLYQRKEVVRVGRHADLDVILPLATEHERASPVAVTRVYGTGKPSLREVTEQAILRQVAPAAALVDSHGDILYLHGRTGSYLEPAPGETGVNNILRMAREGLRDTLASALRKAVSEHQTVSCQGLSVKTNGSFTPVNLIVRPVTAGRTETPETPVYLVILDEAPPQVLLDSTPSSTTSGHSSDAESIIAELRRELQVKEEYLQTTNEELEASNEELRSSNEEIQSANEEAQSTNEELETSKEELQSINEELATVNAELQTNVADLTRANNDMNNLLAGTGIATVFVDHQLRILRFTPTATQIINLIPSDVGRPVTHILSMLAGYDRLEEDVRGVLDTLAPEETEVQTTAGRWYTMRIRPYRTLDNVIEGAVINFVDISEARQMQEALRKADDLLRLAVVVRDAHDAITVQDLDGRILAWNPGAVRMYGWTESEARAMNIRDLVPPEQREEALVTVQQLSRADILQPYRTRRITKDGTVVEVWVTASALVNETGRIYAIATTERAKGLEPDRTKEAHHGNKG